VKKLSRVPLWLALVYTTLVLVGLPVGVSRLWEGWGLPGERLFMLLPLFQFLACLVLVGFLDDINMSRKALFVRPVRPGKLALTILVSWVTVLMMVSGVVFVVLILGNMLSGGEVVAQITRDMATYHTSYQSIFVRLRMNHLWTRVWLFVNLALLVPMTEEWLFRGVLLEGLSRYLPMRWVVIVQAVVFALLHPLGFYTVLYVMIGLLLGWFRVHFRSLWPGIWAHQFQNTLAFVTFLTAGEDMLIPDAALLSPTLLWTLVPFVVVTLGLSIVLIRRLKHWPVTTPTGGSLPDASVSP